ncbi:hypothetical protein, partial [Paraburkholderia sp. BCC1886]|uniref:hypothetical protein n=1 Tax=Paraburkholderia sp. BCC1886 TaxID=2562670 RepID=UPI001C926CE8
QPLRLAGPPATRRILPGEPLARHSLLESPSARPTSRSREDCRPTWHASRPMRFAFLSKTGITSLMPSSTFRKPCQPFAAHLHRFAKRAVILLKDLSPMRRRGKPRA